MPYFYLDTNVEKSKITPQFLVELSKVLAASFDKPERSIVVRIAPDQLMMHGCEEGLCGQAYIRSIGKLGEKENIAHSKVISAKLEELGIPANKLYIHFNDVPGTHIGVHGTTVRDKFGI